MRNRPCRVFMCRLAFCDRHALRHAKGSGGQSLSALLEEQANASDSDEPQASVLFCAVHNYKQPLDFHCVSCGEAVCSHCISIGQHAGHTPIVLHNDVVTKRKDAVLTKVDEL